MTTAANTDAPTRCAIYLRISLDHTGDELAVKRQRQDCQRIAKDRGWTVVGEYVDNSVSAYDRNKRRPDYDRMVADYRAGLFDAVVCYDLDRLTRQPRQLEDWIECAEDRGLQLVTANGECDLATDGGRLFARMKAAVARAEMERKSARQKRAAVQRAEMGRWAAGPALFGYVGTGDKAGRRAGEQIPVEAALVRQMFTRFVAGESLRAIKTWLDDSGAPSRRGGQWNASTVRGILTNPRYSGRSALRGAVAGDGEWEPIVPADVFDVVNARLADPGRKSQQGTDRKHLGSGIYRCGVCDLPLRSHSASYRCKEGGHVMRMRDSVDAYVLRIVLERLSRPDVADLLHRPGDDAGKAASSDLSRLRERLTRIEQDYDDGLIDGRRYQASRAKVIGEMDAAQAIVARSSSNAGAASILLAEDPVIAFANASLGVQRSVIEFLVTVSLLSGQRGHKFNPTGCEHCADSVVFEWHGGE